MEKGRRRQRPRERGRTTAGSRRGSQEGSAGARVRGRRRIPSRERTMEPWRERRGSYDSRLRDWKAVARCGAEGGRAEADARPRHQNTNGFLSPLHSF
jgi:hypothetical protein